MADYAVAFPYCDFFYMKSRGGNRTPTRWRRIEIDSMDEAINEAHAFDCYTSVQRFSSPEPATADSAEIHWCPPYADFDSTNIAVAQADVQRLIQWAREDYDLDSDQIRVWFSGKKGFHLQFSPGVFGVTPMTDLTYVYKRMFSHLAELLGLSTMDLSVYTKRRMWRVPNTVHAGTNLYKRELDHDEITLSTDALCALAKEPRRDPVVVEDEFNDAEVSVYCSEFFHRFVNELLAEQEAAADARTQAVFLPQAKGEPVCITDIMGGGLKKPGDRNKATMALGGYYKDTDQPLTEAVSQITTWALGLPPEHRQSDDAYVKANTASVLKTVYDNDAYHFSCKFIRSLHGPKTSLDYDRVACAGAACPFVNIPQDEADTLDVHLSRIGDPSLLGKNVRTRLRVAGRQESAYLVPSRVTYRVLSDDECNRPHCALHGAGGRIERDFANETDSRTLLSLVGVPDQQLHTNLRRVMEKTSCKGFTYDVEDHVRVIEMMCVPKAETVVYDPLSHRSTDETGGDFVYQRMYAVGLDFKVNYYYEVVGRVYPHPRHQEATMVITDATPTQDAIEDFDLEVAKPLFKNYDNDMLATLGHLIADLGVNVVKVAGRKYALLSLLMAMHSPLELRFDGEAYGGWMQVLMVGDTGEAKSQLVERLVRYVGLGELVSAQSSGRTGLLYTIVNKDTAHNFIQWGSFVLNDRRLLIVDEASGIDKFGYAELRNARRDGVFKVSRSVSGEAQTRTRLIVLSNPRFGKNISDFNHGIEAVEPLFENADIRRFDLVVGFKAGTVKRDQIVAELGEPVEPLFDADTLRNNILWSWSRTADQVVWSLGTTERVKSVAAALNRKYQGSDIHLLSQDANEKIARMAQALAATVHSTDGSHTNIIVKPEHVDLVADMIDALYSSHDLDFDLYVRRNRETTTEINYDEIHSNIIGRIQVPFSIPIGEVIDFFMTNSNINTTLLEAIASDPKDARLITRQLSSMRLVRAPRNGRSGLEPTPMFKEFMRQYARRHPE